MNLEILYEEVTLSVSKIKEKEDKNGDRKFYDNN